MLDCNNNSQIDKILLIASFISILMGLVLIIITPSATSYEISIYAVYPWYFWLMLIFPIIMLFFSILRYNLSNNNDNSSEKYIKLLAIAAILSLALFLLLPFFRGYLMFSGGDLLTHLYFIKTLESTGSFDYNVYPVLHILIVTLHYATGIDNTVLMFFIPLMFVTLFIPSMYLLSRSLNFNKKESLFVILFSILPPFVAEGVYLAPSFEAFLMIPLVLFVLVKSRSNFSNAWTFSTLLIVLLMLFPFFHPEVTLFLLIILLTILVSYFIYNNLKFLNFQKEPLKINLRNLVVPLLFLSVGFLAWFSSTIIFDNTIKTAYDALILNIGNSPIDFYSSTISRVHMQIDQFIEILIKVYEPTFFYVLIAALAVFGSFLKLIMRKKIKTADIFLSCIFISVMILVVLFLFKDLTIGTRPFKYLILVSILLMSVYIAKIFTKWRNGSKVKVLSVFLSMLIVATICVSAIGAYPSPFVNKYNYQIKQTDYSGMEFFFNHQNVTMPIMSITVDQLRWRDLFTIENHSIPALKSQLPKDHFGYDNGTNLGDLNQVNIYLMFSEITTQFYPELYPEYKQYWKYTPEDFEKFKNDPTINLVYDNSGIKLFEVKGKKS